MLKIWNDREQQLINESNGTTPAVALPPKARGAIVGQLEGTPLGEKIKKRGRSNVSTKRKWRQL